MACNRIIPALFTGITYNSSREDAAKNSRICTITIEIRQKPPAFCTKTIEILSITIVI
jgi:hypothetical protein